jgi:hypothetical protein
LGQRASLRERLDRLGKTLDVTRAEQPRAPAPHRDQWQRAAAIGDEVERPFVRDCHGGGQGDEQACLHQRAGEQHGAQVGRAYDRNEGAHRQ